MKPTKKRIESALKSLKGKDLSIFGVRAEATLKLMRNDTAIDKNLRFIEKVITRHYKD